MPLSDERLTNYSGLADGASLGPAASKEVRDMAAELLAVRARIAEVEQERDQWKHEAKEDQQLAADSIAGLGAANAFISELKTERDAANGIIRELRQKLAKAGVEGSPPAGGMGTIPTLLHRARTAEARVKELERERDKWRDLVRATEDPGCPRGDYGCDSYGHREECGTATLEMAALNMQKRADKAEAERDAWRDVIAVLCGDGGHYHQEHGTEATKEHALERFYALAAERDRLRAALERVERFLGGTAAAVPPAVARAWEGVYVEVHALITPSPKEA